MELTKDELAGKLRFPLIPEGYMDYRQVPEVCEAIFSVKRVEQSRKR
jgi:hypothetical protein